MSWKVRGEAFKRRWKATIERRMMTAVVVEAQSALNMMRSQQGSWVEFILCWEQMAGMILGKKTN